MTTTFMRTGTERDADYGEKRTQSPHRLLGLSTYSQPVAPCAALRRESLTPAAEFAMGQTVPTLRVAYSVSKIT